MKKTLILVILLAMATVAMAKKIQGTITFENGNQRTVTFRIPFRLFSGHANYEALQYRVSFFDKGEKLVLRPGEAKEYSFTYRNETVRMVSNSTTGVKGIAGRNHAIFLQLEIEGPLSLYRYYATRTSGGVYSTYSYQTTEYYLKKRDGPLKWPRGLAFRKDMVEYLSDCPSIADKINERELKRRDLEVIVLFYNKNCN